MSENKNAKTPTDDEKPVAWQLLGLAHFRRKIPAGSPARYWDPLYAAPPKREWVGLTDDVVFELADTNLYEGGKNFGVLAFAKAIEQALKEKNA